VLLVVCIDSYNYFNNKYPSVRSFNRTPQAFDGVRIEKVGRMRDLQNNTFTLLVGQEPIKIRTNSIDIKQVKNGYVIVNGVYRKEGYIEMTDIQYSPNHYLKYIISLVGLFITLVYFFREWKFDFKEIRLKCRTY
jgi:hypothetical protein